jgi:hypothetical protein
MTPFFMNSNLLYILFLTLLSLSITPAQDPKKSEALSEPSSAEKQSLAVFRLAITKLNDGIAAEEAKLKSEGKELTVSFSSMVLAKAKLIETKDLPVRLKTGWDNHLSSLQKLEEFLKEIGDQSTPMDKVFEIIKKKSEVDPKILEKFTALRAEGMMTKSEIAKLEQTYEIPGLTGTKPTRPQTKKP